MSTEYGIKLSPYRALRNPKGFKGIRRTISNTHVPDNIDQNSVLVVRFPDLGKDDVIVPGTSKLLFKLNLASTDANRTIVNNLGRAIVSKIEVKLEGESIFTLNDSDIFYCYQDLWKTTKERANAIHQGIQSETMRKIRVNAGDKDESNAGNKAIGDTYKNHFYIPLDFEMLESHMPFFQSELKDRLSYELTFNSYSKVIVSGNADATYTISDIKLEFDVVNSPELATTIKNRYKGKLAILYDKIMRSRKLTLNKNGTVWNIDLAPQAKSMKGILILFIDPDDGGTAFARDSEIFYNPMISNVRVTIDGDPNQLFASGMKPQQHWNEISKNFADGKFRTVHAVSKELELADITLSEYLTTKYSLWLDMRSTDDDKLHGSGRRIEGATQSILIEMERTAGADENLDAYVYYIQDAQLNFENGKLRNVAY